MEHFAGTFCQAQTLKLGGVKRDRTYHVKKMQKFSPSSVGMISVRKFGIFFGSKFGFPTMFRS